MHWHQGVVGVCGRFTLTAGPGEVARHFQAVLRFPGAAARYNIAPGQDIGVVVRGAGGRELIPMHWGLVPFWSGKAGTGRQLINARAETVAQKHAFRDAFSRRRCLVPADGYYEWQNSNGRKVPFRIVCPDIGLFALAGIWNPCPSSGGSSGFSCAILTTPASGRLQEIHDRMPLLLASEGEYARWLLGEDGGPPVGLLQMYQGECMAYAVSTAVNSARHDSPELIVPLDGPRFEEGSRA